MNPEMPFGVDSEKPEVAKRLHSAIRLAGGNRQVATRAGIPLGTLNNYLAGREMKAGAALAIARACGVSLEWLLTGENPPAAPPSPGGMREDTDQEPIAPLSGGLDVQQLAKAIELVEAVVGAETFRDNPRAMAGRIANAYAILTGQEPPKRS